MNVLLKPNPAYSVNIVNGDGVYLTSELGGKYRLPGALPIAIFMTLRHGATRAEALDRLSGYDGAAVEHALDLLLKRRYVHEDGLDPEAGFWTLQQSDPGAPSTRSGKTVRLREFDAPIAPISESLERVGLRISREDNDEADVDLVLVDEYLDSRLEAWNREARESRRPWLLARPNGAVLWLGPLFQPETGCWNCLRHRLQSSDIVGNYVRQHSETSQAQGAHTGTRAVGNLGADLIALTLLQWLAQSDPSVRTRREFSEVVTLESTSMTFGRHKLERRPQCPVCGDPTLQSRLQDRPVAFSSTPKGRTVDGGHRFVDPQEFVRRFEPRVSPITGLIKELRPVDETVPGFYAFTAGQNFAVPMSNILDLRAGLRSAAAGKGMSEVQAKASAIGEAIERQSGLYQRDEARTRSRAADLPGRYLEPNQLHLYSERQFDERDRWNAKGSHFQYVPQRFDSEMEIDWTPIWSVTSQERCYLPTGSLFYGYPFAGGPVFTGADSNGNAAGTSLEDATIQGFFELIERDSVAIWWYNMLRRPEIDLASFGNPYFDRWTENYASLNRDAWVLDLTTDLGIPAVVAISRRRDKAHEDILIAFGAHFDVSIAISRAMTEMNQFLPAVINVNSVSDSYAFPDPDQITWWTTATLENQPYLKPQGLKSASDFHYEPTPDLLDDITRAEDIVHKAGLEMFVLNQTRPDIDVSVVKVIVPGLRHFWTRFAPGRLYDVPVKEGWLAHPRDEAELNPIAMFL